MKFAEFLTLFSSILLVKLSHQSDCSSQGVVFTANMTSFTIQSDPDDLTSKTCRYTFTVPKYFIPTVTAVAVALTGENRITFKQYSEYGGAKAYQITSDIGLTLAPVNFTLEIALPNKTPDDRFKIEISVKDATPIRTGISFMVAPNLGELIDSENILGSSSMVQQFDNDHPSQLFSIRVAVFGEASTQYPILQNVHIYDVGLYKGNLLDVIVAENVSTVCSGTSFAIVNTNTVTAAIYTILVSPTYLWNGQVYVRPAQQKSTDIYTATDGLTVFHEIRSGFMGAVTPSIYQQIAFRGNGTLDVYAGCTSMPMESRRIATITPSNAAFYEQLMLFGRCRTYVLNQGVFQWTKEDTYFSDFHHIIGRKGAIMSDTYPYTYTDNTTTRNYLIQAPLDSKQNIIVEYEVASMAADVLFVIQEQNSAGKGTSHSLTSSSTKYTSSSTYQQYIQYTEPKGSVGFLIRYTVTSGVGTAFNWILMIVFCFWRCLRV